MQRSSGVLLHVTSLPGRWGVGDLGPAAYRWVDELSRAGQGWWQVLPLVPAGSGHSPYSGSSAFGGSPLLVSPELLVRDGLLRRADVSNAPPLPAGKVNYSRAARLKRELLTTAWERFSRLADPTLREAFESFKETEADWLDDFALFTALQGTTNCASWTAWPKGLMERKADALREARRELSESIERECFAQFLFARQMKALRAHAAQKNVKLIGDLPIFVAFESADVWAHARQFKLDRRYHPKVVAGVPPDYFAKTGQRWGNPHYDWAAMAKDDFAWWTRRVRGTLGQVDLIRLDHFRGFEACWAVEASCPTAQKGRWTAGPGGKIFEAFRKALGGLPFIAEDLGVITPPVEKLRDDFELPGMRVLQFAFGGGGENIFLPHHYPRNAVAYTGTHDNDTTLGWFRALKAKERASVLDYVPDVKADPVGALMRLAWSSVADLAVVPFQDVLRLGTAARMNVPGVAEGNWSWRATDAQLARGVLGELAELTERYSRKT